MRFLPTGLAGVIVVEPVVHADARGFFMEAYHREKFRAGGITADFLQDNHSYSRRGVIRGLHLQVRPPQAKLVRVVHGTVFDVVADVRAGSPTYGRHIALELSGENRRQVFVPAGYAHGLQVLSDEAHVLYKVDAFYDARGEYAVRWDDPTLAIPWPLPDPVLSDKDRAAPALEFFSPRW